MDPQEKDLSIVDSPDTGTPAGGGPIAIDETDRLIASDKVAGTAVYGPTTTREIGRAHV